MRAMQIIEWGKPLELRRHEKPEPEGGEVLVQIEACGVCHSDVHIWQGYFDLGNGRKFPISERGVHPPFTMGHEPAGKVVAKGPSAGDVEIGKSYVVYPWIDCGRCEPCRNGLAQICDKPRIIGTRVHGAYADYVIVPDAKYLIDHQGIETERACILACSGLTAYSALKKLSPERLTEADSVLIIGAGGLGLMAVCLARALSPARILVAEIAADKRKTAREIGADEAFDSTDADALARVRDAASAEGRRGIAAAIDFVGLPETMALGIAALRKGGQHVHVGLFGGALPLSLPPLAFRMLRLQGSYVGTLAELKALIALVQDGLDLPVPVTTRPLEAAQSALDDLIAGTVQGRIVLVP